MRLAPYRLIRMVIKVAREAGAFFLLLISCHEQPWHNDHVMVD
jgi:hypothetical protein